MKKLADDSGVSTTPVFHAMPSDSDTAFLAFSALGRKHPQFDFFLTLTPADGVSKLLVRDPSHSFYNAGLPDVGRTVEEIADALRAELAKLGARRVITTGTSMGGYAAILFGCLLGAERAIAIGPQTLLDPVLPYSPPPEVQLQAPDLRPVALAAPETRIEVLVGWDSIVDVFHAQRIADIPSVRTWSLPLMGHASALTLKRDGVLLRLLTALGEGHPPEPYGAAPELPADVQERIGESVFAMARREPDRAADAIRPVAERYPSWAGPWFTLGQALVQVRDWAGAEAASRGAVDANPTWYQAQVLLGQSLVEQGRAAEAAEVYRAAIAIEPDWPPAHEGLGRCLKLLGRHDEADEALRRAAALSGGD